jgi:hypothetical protein
MRLYAILVVVSVIFASFSLAQPSPRHFTFVVQDRVGAPIPEASVHVQHWDFSGGRPGSVGPKSRLIQDGVATTDAHGQVSFELAPVVYEVFASAPGFTPAAATVGNRFETGHVFKLAVVVGDWVEVESLPK